jgi:hypothetical protein
LVGTVALGHVPVSVSGGFQENIAVLSKGSSEFSVDELVLAHVLVVGFTAVVNTVDVTDQIVIDGSSGICHTAYAAFVVYKAVPSGRSVVIGVSVTTAGAGISGVAGGGAGRCSDVGSIAMGESGDRVGSACGPANSAGIERIAIGSTGGSDDRGPVAMTGSCHLIGGIAVAAGVAGMFGIAYGGASGSSDC